jgi:N-glycosylase/DNA lyase
MKSLLNQLEKSKKSKIKTTIESRIADFKKKKSSNEIFQELCFCILTANFNAERSIAIQNKLQNKFLTFPEKTLAKKLKELGHRFPNARAKYIVEARKHKDALINLISSKKENEIREWLVKNIKGLGYKESSHFLRNIGYGNSAIIDFHILDILEKNKLIIRPKTLSRKKYLETENLLRKIAKKSNLNLAELDLHLWFSETGKVLK